MIREKDRIRVSCSSGRDYQKGLALLSAPSLSRAEATGILSSPGIMAELFRTRLSWLLPKDRALIRCVPEVLRKRMSTRQIVSYRLVFSGTRQSSIFVLKRYSDKTEAGRIYSIMRMLWDNGFNRESKLKITEPFSFLEDLGLLVVERAQGRELGSYPGQRGPAALVRMRAVAHWLAKLHHLGIDLKGINPHPPEEAGIVAFVRRAGSKEPRLLKRLEKVASLVLTKLSVLKKVPLVPVHGDFQCGNVFVAKDRVTVIDFDKFCRSDPARDVGYMIAQMRATAFRHAVSYEGVHPGLKAFWDEYLDTASEAQRATLSARTSLFAARKCLQNIDYILLYVTSKDDMEMVDMMIDEAQLFTKVDGIEEALETQPGARNLSSG